MECENCQNSASFKVPKGCLLDDYKKQWKDMKCRYCKAPHEPKCDRCNFILFKKVFKEHETNHTMQSHIQYRPPYFVGYKKS